MVGEIIARLWTKQWFRGACWLYWGRMLAISGIHILVAA